MACMCANADSSSLWSSFPLLENPVSKVIRSPHSCSNRNANADRMDALLRVTEIATVQGHIMLDEIPCLHATALSVAGPVDNFIVQRALVTMHILTVEASGGSGSSSSCFTLRLVDPSHGPGSALSLSNAGSGCACSTHNLAAEDFGGSNSSSSSGRSSPPTQLRSCCSLCQFCCCFCGPSCRCPAPQ